jgi:hypothetical protein
MSLPSHRTNALRPSRAAPINEMPRSEFSLLRTRGRYLLTDGIRREGLGDAILLASHPTGLVVALVVLFAHFLVSPTPLGVLLAERIVSLWVACGGTGGSAVCNVQARPREISRSGLRYPDVQGSGERKPPIPRCNKDARPRSQAASHHAGQPLHPHSQ